MSDYAARSRRGRTFGGLLRSLVPIVVIVVAIVWWQRGSETPVQQVDPSADIAYAQRVSPVPLPVPRTVPADWRPTSSHVDAPAGEKRSPVTLTVGYLTPSDKYAEVVVGDRTATALLEETASTARADGDVRIGATSWQRYRSDRDEQLLVSTVGGAAVLVTGDAPEADLRTLAAAVS